MSARDDFTALVWFAERPCGEIAVQLNAALDEIDRLRANLDEQSGRVGRLTALVEQCMEQRDAAEADADRLAEAMNRFLDTQVYIVNDVRRALVAASAYHADAVAKRGAR